VTGALRRVAVVLVVYAAIAWVALGGGGWLRRTLALPELFGTLLRVGLALGALAAIVLAWRYPELGRGGTTASHEPEGR